MQRRSFWCALAVVLSWVTLVAQGPVRPALVPWVPPDTPLGTGKYKAVMEMDAGLSTHTIYRPADLSALGAAKLPIITWGNGACVNAGNRFRHFLTEIASHGYLAMAVGPVGPREWEAGPEMNRAPGTPPPARESGPATRARQLIDALDWAVAENGRKGSKYYGRLDVSKIAVMGQSCGGVQAIQASADPRVTITVGWNTGVLPQPSPAMENIGKDALMRLHAPIAYFTGDKANDVAFPNAADDFERITNVPVLFAWRDTLVHAGTYREANGGELGRIAVAYLGWRLKGDVQAGRMFTGADCGLCQDARWHVSKKRVD
jgi:dienelactone hydrolase